MSYLREFGFTPREADRLNKLSPNEAKRELERNVASYIEHTLIDQVVSTPFSYWFGPDGRLYTHPSLESNYLQEKNNGIDPAERGGLYVEGFRRLTKALNTSQGVIIHYSPKGEAPFGEELDRKYPYGHLSFQYFDGEKVRGVGVMVSNEELILEILDRLGLSAKPNQTEHERIAYYLLNPLPTNLELEDLLAEIDMMGRSSKIVYEDKDHTRYPLTSILMRIRDSFSGRLPTPNRIYIDKTVSSLNADMGRKRWTEQEVVQIYAKAILQYAADHGLDTVELRGGCGGMVKTTDDIISLLYENGLSNKLSLDFLNPQNIIGLHSTDYRFLTGVSSKKENFICPKCGKEADGPVGDQCPNKSCGLTKKQAVKEGYATC